MTDHVSITVSDLAAVYRFHAEALAHGGTDDGAPGPRSSYHEHYYGAFVMDPNGNRLEAVCHRPA